MTTRRSARRALRLETSGALPDGEEANVVVHNLSAAGLLIETDLSLDVGDTLAIDLPEVGPVGAEIVWQSGRLNGCAFQQALGEAALSATQLRATPADADPRPEGMEVRPGGGSLGERLSKFRRERGLTLAQVAEALNVSKPTVWAWEKDKARPLPERMEAIAETLGVDASQLAWSATHSSGNDVVEDCRLRIATAFATSPSRVKIMIEV
ncbi:MAG: helix-turn-helix domain-containing protein [Erythrobacter sp.]|uniref:helix-turn-helix domain-containing protein n=1 Tax=Erythrobacter sp. TaxID=1042 RepID=UPI003C70E0AC